MLRIVLPAAIPGTISPADIGTIASVYVCVSIEIVVVIYGDVVVPAPSAVITPAPRPHCSHGYSNAEGDRHAGCVVTRRRIRNGRIRVGRWTIYDSRVIA